MIIQKKFCSHGNPLLITLILVVILLITLGCNIPGLLSSQSASIEEVTATIGAEGGMINGPGEVELVVPEGAFSRPVDINLVVGGEHPSLPVELAIEIAGSTVEVRFPPDVQAEGIFELVLPFERKGSAEDDYYTVVRWDGTRWTDAGGLVEGNQIRACVNQFSIFMPARVVWSKRPVSFVNDGPYDAGVCRGRTNRLIHLLLFFLQVWQLHLSPRAARGFGQIPAGSWVCRWEPTHFAFNGMKMQIGMGMVKPIYIMQSWRALRRICHYWLMRKTRSI